MLRFACPVALALLFSVGCGDDLEANRDDGDDGSDGSDGPDAGVDAGATALVSVEGDVLAFLTEVSGPRVVGATVSVLERPELTMVTGDDAHFRFDGLEVGSRVTLVVEHPDFMPTRSATLTLGPGGIEPFPVQIVSTALFQVLSTVVSVDPELDRFCVIATTAARMGGSLYAYMRQGMPGAIATTTPALDAESGPLYFSEAVIPDAAQTATSIDGGVVFVRVPPGDYTMTGSKEGTVWNTVELQCVPGIVVNAGPPLGLLANVVAPDHGAGRGLADSDDTAASDALCEANAACVNQREGEGSYPPSMVRSCKASFRNTWAFVDQRCDDGRALRDAARAFMACRTASCDATLGSDDVCVEEEAAFRAAEATYGACLAAGGRGARSEIRDAPVWDRSPVSGTRVAGSENP